MQADNPKHYAEATAAIARLSDADKALFIAGLLSGAVAMADDLTDLIFENGGDNLAEALMAYVNNSDAPRTDVCGYPLGSRESAIASLAFDSAGGAA